MLKASGQPETRFADVVARRMLPAVLLVLTMLCVLPARADIAVQGVRDGEAVRGVKQIAVRHDGQRLLRLDLSLRGPDGYQLDQQTGRNTLRLVVQQDGQSTTDWDTSLSPAGDYELTVSAVTIGRSGRRVESDTVRFTVEHDQTVSARRDTPGEERITEVPVASFVDEGDARFAVGRRTADLPFTLSGDLPASGDVLVLAWSPSRQELVPDFAHTVDAEPFVVTAEKLNSLPADDIELQLRVRVDGRIVGKTTKQLRISPRTKPGSNTSTTTGTDNTSTNTTNSGNSGGGTATRQPETPALVPTGSPDPTAQLAPPTVLPTPEPQPETPVAEEQPRDDSPAEPLDVRFPASTPKQVVRGSVGALPLEVTGRLPKDADILVLLWHNDQRKMVDSFAHVLTGSPFAIDGGKFDKVPAGQVEMQTLLRVPGEPIQISKYTLELTASADDTESTTGEGDYHGLTLSSDGFTNFTASADTRKVYVAANGNDDNDGLSPQTPLATPAKGYALLRDGYPDWLLFKAGDTFTSGLGTIYKSGRSADQRQVIGVYGEGERPLFEISDKFFAYKPFTTSVDNLAVVGLHLISPHRDTRRRDFSPSGMADYWHQGGFALLGPASNVLFEDLVIEYFNLGFVLQSDEKHGYQTGMQIRRSSIAHCYGHWDSSIGGHAQGIYASYVNGLEIDECVWDHNGWNPLVDGAIRTKFNHNLYIQSDSRNVSVTRNIITRGSAHGLQLRPGGVIEDNLFVGNALAFFTGQEASTVRRNVVLQSDDMSGDADGVRGFGIEILPCEHAVVENNIISQKVGSADHGPAIGINWDRQYIERLEGRDYKVTLRDNKIYDWPRFEGRESAVVIDGSAQMLENTRNLVDLASGGQEDPPWVDPDRDVECYMESLNRTASLEDFLHAATYRPRGKWSKEFSAEGVNHYIRRGFDVRPFD